VSSADRVATANHLGVPSTGPAGTVRRSRTGLSPRVMGPAAVGAVLAAGMYLYFLLADRRANTYTYYFYDLQARSLLHGHWDLPKGSLGEEAFVVHGRTYEYFGPFPAFLRMPIEAFTNRFDGHLGVASMFLAYVVLMLFTIRLAARLRPLVRGSAPVSRAEQWTVGIYTLVLGGGSVVVFLASHTWVYQEAEIWGVALTVAAFDFIVAFASTPTVGNLLLGSAFTIAALLSRAPDGVAAIVALGLVCLPVVLKAGYRLVGLDRPAGPNARLLAIPAVVVPVALYGAVNYAKFGTLVSVPWADQLSQTMAIGAALRRRAGVSMLQARFFPDNLIQYLRPNAVSFSRVFPWWHFEVPPRMMALYSKASSLTSTMPAFVVLGVIGTAGAVRGDRPDGVRLAALRAPLIGAGLGSLITLSYGFVANRYLGDFVPGVVVASLAGLHVTLRWSARRTPRPGAWLPWIFLGVLGLLGAWISLALTDLYASSPF
jgi:hypothetical protein